MELDKAELFFHELFQSCHEDPGREGLKDTPKRFLKSFQELTQGYTQDLKSIVNNALFTCENTQPVVVENLPYYSLCEHHLLPFFGHCRVIYVPNGKVLGLSKIYRIVDLFSHRLQLQERLTQQVGEAIFSVTQAKGVYVEMTGEHLCVAMRGVQRRQSFMRTQYQLGATLEVQKSSPGKPLQTVFSGPETNTPKQQLTLQTVRLPLYLGCYASEQTHPTDVEIQITLQMDQLFLEKDHLSETLCYDQLIQYLQSHCLQKHYQLIEFACREIYNAVHAFLKKHSFSVPVRVHLCKNLEHPLLKHSAFQISDF